MDFWGVVVPNYIGAVGGLAATVLAIVSLVLANRARKADAQTRSAVSSVLLAVEGVAAIQGMFEDGFEKDLQGRRDGETQQLMPEDERVVSSLSDATAQRHDALREALDDARRKLGIAPTDR